MNSLALPMSTLALSSPAPPMSALAWLRLRHLPQQTRGNLARGSFLARRNASTEAEIVE
jgi:hypothetical protein